MGDSYSLLEDPTFKNFKLEWKIDLIIDSINEYLGDDASFEDAAIVPGLFVAFCVNLELISESLRESSGRDLLRIKYREITGPEFLISSCGGELLESHLTSEGCKFAQKYYRDYVSRLKEAVEMPDAKWETYDRIAPWLTGCYFEGRTKKPNAFSKSRWWKFCN